MVKKLYYSASEVAKMFDVPISTITHWEKEIPQMKAERTNTNRIRFKGSDIPKIKLVRYLTKEMKLTLQGVREYMATNKGNDIVYKRADVIKKLTSVKDQLQALRDALNY